MLDQKYFYTAEAIIKEVTKEEFDKFIKNYPRPLTYDCTFIYDPPGISYNDFELANSWPYSIVASTHLYSDNPEDCFYVPPEERNYIIIENYQELFDSKTGNMA